MTGRIVINADEWTLGNAGFQRAADTGRFVANVANWFTDGEKGTFHGYSNNFGVRGSSLKNAMAEAGHTWTTGLGIRFTLDELKKYDGIFLMGNAANNQVMIDYVKAGGCVYLAGGTGAGGARAEARRWKTFLNAFGFKFGESYNRVGGNIAPKSDHPIFAGVKSLYSNNGNSITDIDPDAPENAILVNHARGGLFAVYDLSLAEPNVVISGINYDGAVKRTESDEYVEITNDGSAHTDISGWRIHADDKGQDFVFPDGTIIQSGQSFRVYTNEVHPESGGFSFGIGRAIWNNKGDTALLCDENGAESATLGYGEKAAQ